jgi:D-alanyl-D-alanine carboxypeptidase/D-alanyl-D-alanine-endopeptidase (penicillin-binding protein 4)
VEKGQPQTIHFYRPLNENVIYALGQMPLSTATLVENLAVPSPARLFVSLLQQALTSAGIEVTGKTRTMDWLGRQVESIAFDQMVEIGSIESLPVRELAKEILKPSQNLYTDLLLAHVGEKNRTPKSPKDETSEQLGLRELQKFLAHAGINRSEVLFDEGSGLSRNNLTTPNATLALLQFMDGHPCSTNYLEALPIAGVDGTLVNRMKGTAAEGNLRAKTGTSRWVSSLSGYVKTAAGERLAFSIMLNRFQGTNPGRSAAAELDPVAVMLAEFKGRVDL